ncbi:hypothetical protein QP978_09525 [Corynebacterium sp. MSK035]|uniref:hypothetical protein n=1 Tax=Corynebacterium TaxID=1716 RepID=UPI001245B7BE|nr:MULTISPECIES: hypothetical protein [Corynebacterium]KAA9226407.1 hypothetical protein F6I42_05320 [Corynebacterium amycolatum]MDK8811146.1 hypothetical protein [Corynebacterium sp. MSK035]
MTVDEAVDKVLAYSQGNQIVLALPLGNGWCMEQHGQILRVSAGDERGFDEGFAIFPRIGTRLNHATGITERIQTKSIASKAKTEWFSRVN